MGLSVTEKQELRSIIAKRIQGHIEQLKAEHREELHRAPPAGAGGCV